MKVVQVAAVLLLLMAGCAVREAGTTAVIIEKQGAFAAGGTIIGDPVTSSQHCDHGVVEYQIPPNHHRLNLLMWHSASANAWQNRWDGGEGYQSMFVKRGFPVYIWDGPRVGRGNWGCTGTSYAPMPGVDQQNFQAWRFGATYPQWFEGVQFPTQDPEAWNQATRARYQEFDTLPNARLEADAAAALADRIGPTIAVTNSAGGLRAQFAAIKSDNIKAIIAYEDVGCIFPEGEGPGGAQSAFGPVEVPREQFMRLTKVKFQFVWGDNLDKTTRFNSALAQTKLFVQLINKYGGDAELLMLPEHGLHGNTHLPFADLNNVEVASLMSAYLKKKGLDQ